MLGQKKLVATVKKIFYCQVINNGTFSRGWNPNKTAGYRRHFSRPQKYEHCFPKILFLLIFSSFSKLKKFADLCLQKTSQLRWKTFLRTNII